MDMIQLLDLPIRNVPINQLLCLLTCPNLQLLTKEINVIAVLWATGEQLQGEDIVARRDIYFKHCIGAPQLSSWCCTGVAEEVANEVIEPGTWESILASNCPHRCLEGLIERRVRRVLHIFEEHINVIGRGPVVNLRQHECPTDEEDAHAALSTQVLHPPAESAPTPFTFSHIPLNSLIVLILIDREQRTVHDTLFLLEVEVYVLPSLA